ncbi:uncharacterized protein LOC125194615 [Salvia hispanica]|uniref:uncharacterized protein LOC125194615 n=1 Tax=Salvia hispanica TaxID=49212 RepID=UPI00200900B6|nr:uncharacterized protein LOC125194615 [Salvia hispanica]
MAAAPPPNYSPFTLEPQLNTRKIPSKSDSNALCKTLIVLVLVLAIPLFPSQAPDFITHTVFTDCWEIIHHFFIGIAVSYGIFGRRTSRLVPPKSADPTTGDDSLSYLSGISHITSIFDHGYENACCENDILHNYVNCDDQFVRNDECVVPSAAKIRSFVPNDENERNGNLAWRSESLVVVSNAKCFNGGSSETEFKLLNLPIRSLKSRTADNASDKQEFKKVDEFSSKNYETMGTDKDGDDARIVVNLDKKLGEVIGQSTIPWRSRSGSMETEEEISGSSISKLPAHSCRPHSVGEFEFEHLKSRPLRGKKFSSNPELRSSSERVFSASHSKADSIDSDPFSSSTSSDMDSVGDLGNNLESSGVEEEVRKGKQSIKSFDSDVKSSTLSKVPARAKSVRTIKPKRYFVNQKEQYPSRGESKFGSRFVKTEAADSLIKRREEKPEIPPVDHQNQESGSIFSVPKPKPTISKLHGEEKQGIDDSSSTKSVDREIGFDKSLVEDETIPNIDTDGELGSEVDRKADEFIAKFRKQIRGQKASTSSVEGYSGW